MRIWHTLHLYSFLILLPSNFYLVSLAWIKEVTCNNMDTLSSSVSCYVNKSLKFIFLIWILLIIWPHCATLSKITIGFLPREKLTHLFVFVKNSYLFDGQKSTRSTFFPRGKTRVLLSPEAAGRRNKYIQRCFLYFVDWKCRKFPISGQVRELWRPRPHVNKQSRNKYILQCFIFFSFGISRNSKTAETAAAYK